jgi:hypothetical protein
MIADDLRRQADFFMDVADLAKIVGRTPPVDRTTAVADRTAPVDRTMATVDPKGT